MQSNHAANNNRQSSLARGLRAIPVMAASLWAAFAAPAAHAQGCALCYTSVAGGGDAAIHALKLGVISLLTPALLLFMGVFLLIFLRARAASRAQSSVPNARPVRVPRAQGDPARIALPRGLPTAS